MAPRDDATGTNIRDRKVLNDSDLSKLDQSSYENKGGPVAVESVALVCFQPVLPNTVLIRWKRRLQFLVQISQQHGGKDISSCTCIAP
jgi:hypothetical protein